MTFLKAIGTCLRRYVKFSGRAARPEYWWFVLFLLLTGILSVTIDRAIYGEELVRKVVIDELSYATLTATGPFEKTFWLLTCLPFLAAGWRRMHDTGRSGLHLFTPFFLFAGFGFALILLFEFGLVSGPVYGLAVITTLASPLLTIWWLTRPSEPGSNRYGPNPQEVTT